MDSQTVTVFKQNHVGGPVLSCEGKFLAESSSSRLVNASFSGVDAVAVDKITFCEDDLMLDQYYTDRWYNLFEVHHGPSDQVKCW